MVAPAQSPIAPEMAFFSKGPSVQTGPVIPGLVRTIGPAPQRAWRMLGWIGLVFLVMGFVDIALGWYPLAFGNPEWEFGTISGSLNAFALPILGIYLIAASAVARGARKTAKVAALFMGILAGTLFALTIIFLTVIPMAANGVRGNALLTLGMQKAIAKAIGLLVSYGLLLIGGAVVGWTEPDEEE